MNSLRGCHGWIGLTLARRPCGFLRSYRRNGTAPGLPQGLVHATDLRNRPVRRGRHCHLLLRRQRCRIPGSRLGWSDYEEGRLWNCHSYRMFRLPLRFPLFE